MERWLKQWANDPDAEAKNATPDDRSGAGPACDGFLKGAYFCDNGSRVLLTTRAVPSALDENLPVMVGDRHGYGKRLPDLKPDETIGLLDELGVEGEENAEREAVIAYSCHAYAVHVLGSLLRPLAFRCRYAEEFGDHRKPVQGVNEAMQWFLEEAGRNRTTEPWLKRAAEFAEDVRGNQEILLEHGLDEALWQRFQASLGPPA